MNRLFGACIAIGVSMCLAATTHGMQYRVVMLPLLGPFGDDGLAINNLGQAVGNAAFQFTRRPTYYDGEFRLLDDGGGSAFGIDDAGRVLIGSLGDSFIYDATGRHLLPFSASAISSNGLITGQLDGNDHHACLYDGSTVVSLGTLGGNFSGGTDVNALGHVIGTSYTSGIEDNSGFFYDGSVMRDMGTLNGDELDPVAINDHDQVVGVTRTTVNPRGFLYDGTTVHDLGQYQLVDVNNRGQILGQWGSDLAIWQLATGWEPIEVTAPNDPAFREVLSLEAMNDSGQIVATVYDEFRRHRMAILNPVPEPSVLAFGVISALLTVAGRRRHE